MSNKEEDFALSIKNNSKKTESANGKKEYTENNFTFSNYTSNITIEQISELVNEFRDLRKLIENRLNYDKVKEEAFRKLYEELNNYKKNDFFERNRPLFYDLIILYDRIEKVENGLIKASNNNHEILSLIGSFKQEILEILYRRDIQIIEVSSKIFNPNFQKAIGTEIALNNQQDSEVIQVLRKGFCHKGQIIRPEEVIIAKHKICNCKI